MDTVLSREDKGVTPGRLSSGLVTPQNVRRDAEHHPRDAGATANDPWPLSLERQRGDRICQGFTSHGPETTLVVKRGQNIQTDVLVWIGNHADDQCHAGLAGQFHQATDFRRAIHVESCHLG